jgi:hypothetical protein
MEDNFNVMKKFLGNILLKTIALTAALGIIVITGSLLLILTPFSLLLKLAAWLRKS